jgi:hypothetical protein
MSMSESAPSRKPNAGVEHAGATSSVSAYAIAACAVACAVLWLTDFFILKTPLLTRYRGAPPLTPLYAFWSPLVRVELVLFCGVAALLVVLAARLCDPGRTSRGVFLGALAGFGLVLPFALFLVRQDERELGTQFLIYASEEFYADARRIIDLGPFWREYVRLMPSLSLHGQHFPPGHATLLHLIQETLGAGTHVAGMAILAIFAIGLLLAYGALRRLATESGARQGALFLLACPSLLDFACTSMDAVFFTLIMLCWRLALRALAEDAQPLHAAWTGAALALASLFSFSTFPVGMTIAIYAVYSGRKTWRRTLVRLVTIGASYGACIVCVYAFTGFPLWTCIEIAHDRNYELMTRALGRDPYSIYGLMCYGNAVAFLIGSGLAIVPAAVARLRSERLTADDWTIPLLVSLAIMSFGGIYFMETERIWVYAMPWVAALAVSTSEPRILPARTLIAAGLVQSVAMEILLFTLW